MLTFIHKTRFFICLALIAVAVFGLTSAYASETDNTGSNTASNNSYKIRMLWLPQAEFAGFYMAQEDGLYQNAGLDVTLEHPLPEEDLFDSLKNGQTDIIVSWLTSALDRAVGGDDIVNIGQMHKSSSLMMIARKTSGIENPQDMEGKNIGMWIADSLRTPFISYLARYDVKNYRILPILTSVDLFLYNGVDVTVGMKYDEYYRLFMLGMDYNDLNIFELKDTFTYLADDGMYATKGTYLRSPENIKKIRQATMQGWKNAFADKKRTLQLIKKMCKAHNIPFNYAQQRWMLNVMEEMIQPNENDGLLEEKSFKQTLDIIQAGNRKGKGITFTDFAPDAKGTKGAQEIK